MSVQAETLEDTARPADETLVDYWYRQSLAPLQEFMGVQRPELGDHSIKNILADYSMAAAGLHNRLLDARFPGDPTPGTPEASNLKTAKNQHTAGYLLAFVIVHQAGLTLDKLSELYAQAYEIRITEHPDYLVDDFQTDYPGFPDIINLVDFRMTDPNSKFAAMVMFAMHGSKANPGRPAIQIAQADETAGRFVPPQPRKRHGTQAKRAARANNRPQIH